MSLEKIINDAWENRDQINQNSEKSIKDAINQIIEDLDSGKSRVAEKINGEWITHQHLKKAIMLSFRIYGMETLSGPYSSWHDKAHILKGKTAGWTSENFENLFPGPPKTPNIDPRITNEPFLRKRGLCNTFHAKTLFEELRMSINPLKNRCKK